MMETELVGSPRQQATASHWGATVWTTLMMTSLILRQCNWLSVGLAAATEKKREREGGGRREGNTGKRCKE